MCRDMRFGVRSSTRTNMVMLWVVDALFLESIVYFSWMFVFICGWTKINLLNWSSHMHMHSIPFALKSCRRLWPRLVPVQHRTVSHGGYDAHSYSVPWRGKSAEEHVIGIANAFLWTYLFKSRWTWGLYILEAVVVLLFIYMSWT